MKEEGSEDITTLNYIEMPLNFLYNINTPKGKFFMGAGPSLGFGISGKSKWKDGTESGSDDVKFGSGEDDDLKPFEIGANVLAGYLFKGGFMVSTNYNMGLSNLFPGDESLYGKITQHNNYFGINIGYIFPGKTK